MLTVFSDGGRNQGVELISDLMILLGHGGFFRDNGVNSLPSISFLADRLNEPNIFKNVSYKTVKTTRLNTPAVYNCSM